MRYLPVLLTAGGLVLGTVTESRAQLPSAIAMASIGQGMSIGTPAGYSYGYPNFSSYGTAGVGYSGLSAGSMGYSRGYGGLTAPSYLAGPGSPTWGGTGYGYRPTYPSSIPAYSTYNSGYPGSVARPYYGTYSYGTRRGFRPFRAMGRGMR